MTVFQVGYDLNQEGQDYDELFNAIKSLGDHIHILESTWIVDVEGYKTADIRDELQNHIDSNDQLLVTKLTGGWATSFSNNDTDWLHEHL